MYLLGYWQSLGRGVKPPKEFFLHKIDICIAKSQKKHFQKILTLVVANQNIS